MPRRPVAEPPEELNPGWLAAQRRQESLLARPARLSCAAALALAAAVAALWLAGSLGAALGAAGLAGCLAGAAAAARAVWRGEQQLAARIEAERQRLGRLNAARQQRHSGRLASQAAAYQGWQQRRAEFRGQPLWYAVSLPAQIDRIDVAGGNLTSWAAMLTMIAAPRLSLGGEVTVLDLTEAAVGQDLLAVARRSGIEPLVWVLPADLPRLDLGTGLGARELSDLLAQAAAAGDEPGGPGAGAGGPQAADSAILDRVLDVLGDQAGLDRVVAALRFLGQASAPREALRSGPLTAAELDRLSGLFGRGAADRIVIERAWALESRLGRLERLGSAPVTLPSSRLRVAWLDRRCGAAGARVLGSYLTAALTQLLRQGPDRPAWQHTLFLLGAEKLGAGVLDRLEDACELSGTGLVAAYRSIPPHVASRLGRGNAAVAFMRLGNAQDARFASEQIGTEHRFVLSQLTDTVGTSVTDTVGDSYTSTVGTSDSIADSAGVSVTAGRSRGRGRSSQAWQGPFGGLTGNASRDASQSAGTSDSRSLTEGISSGTSWGLSTSRAAGLSTSVAGTAQRSREFLVEQHELQRLPVSAMLVSYPAGDERQVVLADANPAIITLPTATLRSLAEARAAPARPRPPWAG